MAIKKWFHLVSNIALADKLNDYRIIIINDKKILEEQNLINAIKADIKILKKTREKLELL